MSITDKKINLFSKGHVAHAPANATLSVSNAAGIMQDVHHETWRSDIKLADQICQVHCC